MPPLEQADAEGARVLLTSVLSLIFYARSAFPADCFRVVSPAERDHPHATHATLMSPQGPLSSDPGTRDRILAAGGPGLYIRESDNARMAKFLETLDQAFDLIQHRRLGKIQFCFTKSKTWERLALLEFYSLKFSYTELGSVYVYLDWGGTSAAPIPASDEQCLRAFLRELSTLNQPFYVHPFLYCIDGTTLGGSNRAGVGRNFKEAVTALKKRKAAKIGRIQKFIYHSVAEKEAEFAAEDAEREAEIAEREAEVAEREAEIAKREAELAAEATKRKEKKARRREGFEKKKQKVKALANALSFESSKRQKMNSSLPQLFDDEESEVGPSQKTQSTRLCSTPPGYEAPSWMDGTQKLDSFATSPATSVTIKPSVFKNTAPRGSLWPMSGEEDMPPTQPPGDPTGLSESMIHGRRHEMASSIQSTSSYQSRRTSSQAQL